MKKEEFLAISLLFGLKMYKESLHGEIETPYKLTPEWLKSALEFKNKPILRPLSDLTKPIEHNGETFVPIVELAKIAEIENSDTKATLSKLIGNDNLWGVRFNVENDDDYDKFVVFGYDTIFGFGVHYRPSMTINFVKNQIDLWLKLVEWHFDIAGLIEKGEAINVNTLPENPYK